MNKVIIDTAGGQIEVGQVVIYYCLPERGKGCRMFPRSRTFEGDIFTNDLVRFKSVKEVSGPAMDGAYKVTFWLEDPATCMAIVQRVAERCWARADRQEARKK